MAQRSFESPGATVATAAHEDAGHAASVHNNATQDAGRLAVSRMLDDEPVARLDLCADTESASRTNLTFRELREHRIGHTFLRLTANPGVDLASAVEGPSKVFLATKGETQFGFWPAHGAELNPLDSWTEGLVRDPDYLHTAKGTVSFALTKLQLSTFLTFVNAHRHAPYSVYFYNCTTFALEAVRAAGQQPPGEGPFGQICVPNNLYAAILRQERKGDRSATTTPLESVSPTRLKPESQDDVREIPQLTPWAGV